VEKRCVRLGITFNKMISDKHVRIGAYLQKILPGVLKIVCTKNLVYVYVKKEKLFLTLLFLKKHHALRLNSLLDIWGMDNLGGLDRFIVNYLLLSVKYNTRVIVKVLVDDFSGLESVETIFSSAGWLEREVWDMFGVYFYNNKDLRRILTDYGFEGYPLRKDFPLSGFVEVRYDDSYKTVLQEPLEVSQAFRIFDFKSPWE